MADFKRKASVGSTIPTGSMADITFLLLVFFMVATVFVRYRIPGIVLPEAQKIEELKKRRLITYVFITSDRKIYVNDAHLRLDQLARVLYDRRVEEPRMVVSLKCDRRVSYGLISGVLEEFREADALRVNFATERQR